MARILSGVILWAFAVAGAAGADSEALFPPGEFLMGSDDGAEDERPRHKVYLDSFYLDRYEVTSGDFAEYLKANPEEGPPITGWMGRDVREGHERRPVIGLSWRRCNNYCAWRGKRLPTEAEWERAAAGLEGRRYPWGNEAPDKERANFNRCCFVLKGEVLAPVGSYEAGKTPEGVYDMAGNIAEWVYDWYAKDYYQHSAEKNPRGPDSGKHHTIRGGAWNSISSYMRSADRYGLDDSKDFYGIGCRCARSGSEAREK